MAAKPEPDDLSAAINDIRRCFWLLATISDDLIADLGLTASLRAILEHLHDHGDSTVPQIAEEKSVKRQSIQALVDQLREQGLVTTRPNPAHRRSVFIALTPEGVAAFRAVQAREAADLGRVRATIDPNDLEATVRALGALRRSLSDLAQERRDVGTR